MALISSFDLPNTTRRCAGEVELYRWMIDLLRADRAIPPCARSNPRAPAPAPEARHRPARGLSSMSRRLKVNSVFDADGKPTSISLKPHFHERLEQLEFLRDVHRHGERLVAIAQIHAAPARRVREDAVGPLPVRQVHRRERTVFFRRIFLHKILILLVILILISPFGLRAGLRLRL